MHLKEAIIALFFYILITLIFFHKIFLGLIPLPSDLIVGAYYPWLDYKWPGYVISVPIHNPKLSDAVSIFYPLKTLAAESLKNGQLPLWNPYMFGGYPLYASVQLGLLFPTMIFYLLFSSPIAWTIQVMFQPFLASFFMYLFLRYLKLSILPSIFGSITYGFGGFSLIWMQWNTQCTTSLFLPILILIEDKYLTSRSLKWGILFSILISLQIFAGYLPVIPFTFVGMILWYVFRLKKSIHDFKILLFLILGVTLSAIFLLPVGELIKNSQRIVENLGTNSPFISLKYLITLIAPDFFGNDATANFWGSGDHMDFTMFTGTSTLVFAMVGIKYFCHIPIVKFAISLFILTLIFSVANPLSVFLYKLGFWGGDSITMNRSNFLINFSLSILGAYGLSIIKNNYSKLNLKFNIWVLASLFGAAAGLFYCKWLLSNQRISDEISMWLTYINVSLRNLIFPTLIIVTVFIFILFIKKFTFLKKIAEISFILILIIELFRFGLKFNTFSKIDYIYPETPTSQFLEKYPNDRFIAEKDVFPANMWVPFKISTIEGYDGIYPIKSAKFLAVANSGDVNSSPQSRWGIIENFDSKMLDLSNTRFLVAVKRDDFGKVSENGQIFYKLRIPRYKEIFADKGVAILENIQSLPRAYLTKQVIKVPDKETLRLMLDENFPIKDISLSDFEWNNSSAKVLQGNLIYEQITNSHVKIKTTSNIDAYLVVLDSYYPGWKALIDGKETIIHRTNYNFRGIILPKGSHVVDFIYDPQSLKYGAIISAFSLLVIIFLVVAPRFKR